MAFSEMIITMAETEVSRREFTRDFRSAPRSYVRR